MSAIKELDPEVAQAAIKDYEDALSSEAQELDKLYHSFKCPRGCGQLQREIDARHTFSDENYLVGRALLRCKNCGYLIDPHTHIILESGSASKIPVESSPILQPGRDLIGEFEG
jgi:hypothetical protein